MQTVLIALSQIKVVDRLRKDFGDIDGLAQSIKDVGLINPLTIDTKYMLLAGERRFRAVTQLGWTEVPCVLRETENCRTLSRMIELEENVRRKDMNWKEHVCAVAEIHKERTHEAHLEGERWAQRHTGILLGLSDGKVDYCLMMAEFLRIPEHPVHAALSLREAFRILMREKEDAEKRIQVAASLSAVAMEPDQNGLAVAHLAVSAPTEPVGSELPDLEKNLLYDKDDPRFAPKSAEMVEPDAEQCIACGGMGKNTRDEVCRICHGQPVAIKSGNFHIPLSRMLFRGDSLQWLREAKPESIDHIVADPPYAIDVSMMQQDAQGLKNVELTAAEHQVKENQELLALFMPLAYKVLKPGGFCVLWCDNMMWHDLYDWGIVDGFKVQRWPLVWVKTGACMNSAPGYNFTKATEFAIVMRKGNATLAEFRPLNYILEGGADKALFSHPFAKPIKIIDWIIRGIAHPGQSILDPFMGSGTTIHAAIKCGCSPIGIEINELFYNEAINNTMNLYRCWLSPREVVFS